MSELATLGNKTIESGAWALLETEIDLDGEKIPLLEFLKRQGRIKVEFGINPALIDRIKGSRLEMLFSYIANAETDVLLAENIRLLNEHVLALQGQILDIPEPNFIDIALDGDYEDHEGYENYGDYEDCGDVDDSVIIKFQSACYFIPGLL